ncbi:MAG TPA: hypothetical protein VMV93_13875 [Chloroflexota bacterium]|nr:hypothetical protein [Chloroflexota bacterium]
MAVWKQHGTQPPPEVLAHMQARLLEIAEQHFGPAWLDDHMRNIPSHYHVHARPMGGFFGRDFVRRG